MFYKKVFKKLNDFIVGIKILSNFAASKMTRSGLFV